MDGKVLSYYEGTFESAFVLLSPFIRPFSILQELFAPETYPDRASISKDCKAVSWAQAANLVGLPTLEAVDIGLRTRIGALKKEFANQDYASKIDALFDEHKIIPPCEGGFSDLLHDKVLQFIQDLGYQWVWVGDEFCTERKLYWIDDLKSKDALATNGTCNVFTPDKQLLWTAHWDSHFSFLCSSLHNLELAKLRSEFEGFLCAPSTEVFWSVATSVR